MHSSSNSRASYLRATDPSLSGVASFFEYLVDGFLRHFQKPRRRLNRQSLLKCPLNGLFFLNTDLRRARLIRERFAALLTAVALCARAVAALVNNRLVLSAKRTVSYHRIHDSNLNLNLTINLRLNQRKRNETGNSATETMT